MVRRPWRRNEIALPYYVPANFQIGKFLSLLEEKNIEEYFT
jgi:hypothetical protein